MKSLEITLWREKKESNKFKFFSALMDISLMGQHYFQISLETKMLFLSDAKFCAPYQILFLFGVITNIGEN
jgi:hypothetical protein